MTVPPLDQTAADYAVGIIESNYVWGPNMAMVPGEDERARRHAVAEILARTAIIAYLACHVQPTEEPHG